MHPARMLRHVTRAIALRLLAWSADHSSPAAHPIAPTTTTQTTGPSHAQRIRRHHLQRALEAERDRATAHARMSPFSL
jgi:hypothetical protein